MIDKKVNLERWEMYKSGFYDMEIAEFQNVSKKTISSWRKCRNLPPNQTKEECSFLLNVIKTAIWEDQYQAI